MHLANGAKASVAFQPKFFYTSSTIPYYFMENSCANVLNALSSNWTEHDLDTYVVQHPIIGKITVRELLFLLFTTKHHQQTISMLQKAINSLMDKC